MHLTGWGRRVKPVLVVAGYTAEKRVKDGNAQKYYFPTDKAAYFFVSGNFRIVFWRSDDLKELGENSLPDPNKVVWFDTPFDHLFFSFNQVQQLVRLGTLV